jgi:3-oxoacyl-[acyl-carrier protein] reductase
MKKVIITGASGSIGRAITRVLASKDSLLFLHYRRENPEFTKAVQFLKQEGMPFLLYQADFKEQLQIDQMMSFALEQLGSVDLLVNNAGLGCSGLIQEMSLEQWQDLLQINLTSVFTTTQRVLPGMIQKKCGNIINISSIWGMCGASCEVAYSATKAAIIGFSKALAAEIGPCGIRVNCITPGVIDTPMNSMYSPQELANLAEDIPLLRLGKPEEVASLVRFLASEEASYITGQSISPNGGLLRM